MAQERVRQWAIRFVPAKVDEETRAKRIRVQTETQILDTWEAPFQSREQWCDEMEALLECTAQLMPIRRHTVTFTAEDAAGQPLSQCTTTIMGTNKEAADFANGNGVKALAEAMNSIATTMEKVLVSARTQLESATKAVAAMSDEIQDLHQLQRARRAFDTAGGDVDQTDSEVTKMLLAKLEQYGPAAAELAQMYLQTKGASVPTNSAVSGLGQAAAKAATNGKAPS